MPRSAGSRARVRWHAWAHVQRPGCGAGCPVRGCSEPRLLRPRSPASARSAEEELEEARAECGAGACPGVCAHPRTPPGNTLSRCWRPQRKQSGRNRMRFNSHSGKPSSEHKKSIVWREFKQAEMINVVTRRFLRHKSFSKINLFRHCRRLLTRYKNPHLMQALESRSRKKNTIKDAKVREQGCQ